VDETAELLRQAALDRGMFLTGDDAAALLGLAWSYLAQLSREGMVTLPSRRPWSHRVTFRLVASKAWRPSIARPVNIRTIASTLWVGRNWD
jgi:hypothetical protein